MTHISVFFYTLLWTDRISGYINRLNVKLWLRSGKVKLKSLMSKDHISVPTCHCPSSTLVNNFSDVSNKECLCQSPSSCYYLSFLSTFFYFLYHQFPASLSLSFDVWPDKCRCSLQRGELPTPSNFYVYYSVSIPCFNMNVVNGV